MKKILSALIAAFMLFCTCNANKTASGTAINENETYTAEDLEVLQDYLLCRRKTLNGKNFDLNNDGQLDAFDMCLLRKAVMNYQEDNEVYDTFSISANGSTFTAKFADNSSAEAFRELLKKGSITISMHDYGSFEKVGDIGTYLPRNDEKITTEPGDVILYLGTSITVYYEKNTWNFTRLGKIENVTKEQLLEVFGAGDVNITFSLN